MMGLRTLSVLIYAMILPQAFGHDTSAFLKLGERPVVANELPQEYQDVGIDEHLGQSINLGLEFSDESGAKVHLGQFFQSGHPVLMAMVYYTCPNLCNFQLNGMLEAMKSLKWSTGQDYQLVAVSMNPRESAEVAAKKKANYLKSYGRPGAESGWHFLTGTDENVHKLAAQLGFRYKWIEAQKQYSHSAASYLLTPGGTISRYLYGIAPESQTLRLGLMEASNGQIGSVVDQMLMFCFHFDPAKNKYTLYAYNVMRLGAALTVVLLGLILVPTWRRASRQERASA